MHKYILLDLLTVAIIIQRGEQSVPSLLKKNIDLLSCAMSYDGHRNVFLSSAKIKTVYMFSVNDQTYCQL